MRLPEGMTPAHAERLRRMREGLRERALERAAIIQEATGCTWAEADAAALADMRQPILPGVGS